MTPAEREEYKLKNKQDSRWVVGRARFPNRGGISIEIENELLRFFRIEQPERQWKVYLTRAQKPLVTLHFPKDANTNGRSDKQVLSKAGGVVETMPNLTDESLAVWKRLQAERRKARLGSSASDKLLLYSKRKDWWPKVQGMSEAEKVEKIRVWEEEGGWRAVGDFELDSASKSDSDWDSEIEGV